MRIETVIKKNVVVLRVQQDTVEDTDLTDLYTVINENLGQGRTTLALSLAINAYPYSKLIAVLVQCNKLITEQGGSLIVIQPNTDFIDILRQTKLHTVFTIVSSEEDLHGR